MKTLSKEELEKLMFEHIGDKSFVPEKVKPVMIWKNPNNKPMIGGLWFSSIGAKKGWRAWTKENDYDLKDDWCWEAMIRPDSVILRIDSENDVKELPVTSLKIGEEEVLTCIDYEELQDRGIDGIYYSDEAVEKSETEEFEFGKPTMHFWDCETLFLFNHLPIKNLRSIKE